MRYRNLLIVLIFIAPVTVSLTTAEYMAMASEMSDSMNGAFLILYTIISASYIAFFGFGWNSGYLIRALSGLGCYCSVAGLLLEFMENGKNTT